MSEEIERVNRQREADYQVLSAGLSSLRMEMREGFDKQTEVVSAMRVSFGSSLVTVVRAVEALHVALVEGMENVQTSIVRLARTQSEQARTFDLRIGELIEATGYYETRTKDALDVVAREFDIINSRLDALEKKPDDPAAA